MIKETKIVLPCCRRKKSSPGSFSFPLTPKTLRRNTPFPEGAKRHRFLILIERGRVTTESEESRCSRLKNGRVYCGLSSEFNLLFGCECCVHKKRGTESETREKSKTEKFCLSLNISETFHFV